MSMIRARLSYQPLYRYLYMTMKFLVIGLIVLTAYRGSASSSEATAQAPQAAYSIHVDLAGQIGGFTTAVGIRGNLAYINVGPRIVILDVTFPSAPIRLGQTAPLLYARSSLTLNGNYLYAVGGYDLWIIDIQNPVAPLTIGHFSSPSYIDQVVVNGIYAYVSGYAAQVRVVDVSNPANPVDTGVTLSTPTYVRGLFLDGSSFLYIAGNKEGVYRYDLSNPAQPSNPLQFAADDARALVVAGDYAYVLESVSIVESYFETIKLTNPILRAKIDLDKSAQSIQLMGNYAIVTAVASNPQIVDITTPLSPAALPTKLPAGSSTAQLAVAGSRVFIASENYGLSIFDLSVPDAPVKLGEYKTLGLTTNVAVKDQIVYTGNWFDSVSGGPRAGGIVMATQPQAPRYIGDMDLGSFGPAQMVVTGGRLYIIDHWGTRKIFIGDLANPTHPTLLGKYEVGNDIACMAIQDDYVYYGNQFGNDLGILDASDPANPAMAGVFATSAPVEHVAVAGNFVYLDSDGLRIVDATNMQNPQARGVLAGIQGALVISGNYVYAANHSNGLQVVDIQDKDHPTLITTYAVSGLNGLTIWENFAFLATNYNGLQIVDISDPAYPTKVGEYSGVSGNGDITQIAVEGQLIYYAMGDDGLSILWWAQETSESIPASGGSLVSTSDGVEYDFPAGAFSQDTLVTHNPRFLPNLPNNGPLVGVGPAYEVQATAEGSPVQPSLPYTVTIPYASGTPIIEDTLALYYLDNGTWMLEPTSQVNTGTGTVTATPSHLSVWAIFGQTNRVFTPMIQR